MKFQILVPQYKEIDEEIKPLLDSIAIQQNVDFNEIGVIICNDGSDVFLSEELLNSYPFKIEYYKEPHRGVSGTRNACLDYATAEYVAFCDADDMYYNACGFWLLFREMEVGFDSMVSAPRSWAPPSALTTSPPSRPLPTAQCRPSRAT